MSRNTLLLGAVAYDPKVVTIWDGFLAYFEQRELDFDYILYTNYERQVEALRLMVNEGVELNNRRYREMFDITDRSALRDLHQLADLGLIRRLGERRSARYVATNVGISAGIPARVVPIGCL